MKEESNRQYQVAIMAKDFLTGVNTVSRIVEATIKEIEEMRANGDNIEILRRDCVNTLFLKVGTDVKVSFPDGENGSEDILTITKVGDCLPLGNGGLVREYSGEFRDFDGVIRSFNFPSSAIKK